MNLPEITHELLNKAFRTHPTEDELERAEEWKRTNPHFLLQFKWELKKLLKAYNATILIGGCCSDEPIIVEFTNHNRRFAISKQPLINETDL